MLYPKARGSTEGGQAAPYAEGHGSKLPLSSVGPLAVVSLDRAQTPFEDCQGSRVVHAEATCDSQIQSYAWLHDGEG